MKYVRRFMFFIASRLVIITLCVALLLCAFYMAYNMGNAYILVTEGLEKRVDVCLTRQDYVELNKYFTVGFLNSDPVLAVSTSANSPYIYYTINSYDYDVKISSLQAWPWDNEMSCVVTEYVNDISGSVKASYAREASSQIPEWASGRYKVYLAKQSDGSWKISGIIQDSNYRDAG